MGRFSEYDLVRSGTSYLRLVWSSPEWRLFQVQHPTPIVAAPARLLRHSQSALTGSIPCARTVHVRVRWSKFLAARLTPAPRPPGSTNPATAGPPTPHVSARVRNDGSHWTTVTTTRAGTYQLRGSLRRLLR